MHNAYGILSQSNDHIPDNKTVFVDHPPSQQDANVRKHRRQSKIARRQHIKLTLRLLSKNKNLFLDNSITQAEDERTVLAKGNQTNTHSVLQEPRSNQGPRCYPSISLLTYTCSPRSKSLSLNTE